MLTFVSVTNGKNCVVLVVNIADETRLKKAADSTEVEKVWHFAILNCRQISRSADQGR